MGLPPVVSAIPWGKIITYGPTIVETAGALLDSVRKRFGKKKGAAASPDQADLSLAALADRVSALEANEVRQAELVADMANQLGDISKALEVMSKRIALATYVSLTALVAVLILVAVVFSK
jgi:hypothetical protein